LRIAGHDRLNFAERVHGNATVTHVEDLQLLVATRRVKNAATDTRQTAELHVFETR